MTFSLFSSLFLFQNFWFGSFSPTVIEPPLLPHRTMKKVSASPVSGHKVCISTLPLCPSDVVTLLHVVSPREWWCKAFQCSLLWSSCTRSCSVKSADAAQCRSEASSSANILTWDETAHYYTLCFSSDAELISCIKKEDLNRVSLQLCL